MSPIGGFGGFGGPRWRRVSPDELGAVRERLASWPCPPGGAVRHMFPLATIDDRGASAVRVVEEDGLWAACIVLPRRLLVPGGDPGLIRRAGLPIRRWRLVVGDAAAADGLLDPYRDDPAVTVHVQRFQTVDPELVPGEDEVADPGLRRALPADVEGLAQLAVQLHIDDDYGPDPGRSGLQAYRERMSKAVENRTVVCVGEPGDPVAKLEYAVDSPRWGSQLSGIVVRPDARGAGLGFGAVTAAVRRCLRVHGGLPVTLHVRAENRAALRTYRGAGFVDREEWRLAVRS